MAKAQSIKDAMGRLKQTTRRFRSSLDLSAFAKGPASTISHAPAIRFATKVNSKHQRSGVNLAPLTAAAQRHELAAAFFRSAPRLEGDIRSAARMNRKTFSESFSKRVRNCLFEPCRSSLNLLRNLLAFASKTGHELPEAIGVRGGQAGSHSLRGIERRSQATAEFRQHQRTLNAIEISEHAF